MTTKQQTIKLCGKDTPGPYKLPSLVGYKDHDPTKWRGPAYSLGLKTSELRSLATPGPYYYDKITRFGKETSPKYSIRGRLNDLNDQGFPGPGAYKPEQHFYPMATRSPAYSLASRTDIKDKGIGPGPNVYKIPTTIGPKVPDLKSYPAITLKSKRSPSKSNMYPGPNAYPSPNLNVYLNKAPTAKILGRAITISDKTPRPGPNAYLSVYNTKANSPKWSMGMKSNECVKPYITPLDSV